MFDWGTTAGWLNHCPGPKGECRVNHAHSPPWSASSCTVCSKKMWREKMARDMHDTCFACREKQRLRRALAPPLPPPLLPVASGSASAGVLDDLGISMETFRQIRNLQNREISENDYDLLRRLARKPSIKVLEAHQLPHVTTTFRADAEWAAANKDANCAICLCAMSSGEELCRLACHGQHTFHSHCITEWLRTASRCCPVDQHDLSECCLTC